MTVSTRIASAALALGLLAISAAPVFADETTVNAGASTNTTVTTPTVTPETDDDKDNGKHKGWKVDKKKEQTTVDLVCMQNAVVAREDAIIAALDTYHTNVKAALTTRRDALKAAWTISDKDTRKEAIRKAWSDFKGTWKKERKALNEAKRAAWKKFNETGKTCNARGEGEDQGNDRDL